LLSSRRRSSKARWWRSTTRPARSRQWSAAGISSQASSIEPFRHAADGNRPSKPIVYTTAIDRGFTPVSIIIDEPVSYTSDIGQVYAPQNYDHKYEGADHAAAGTRGLAQHSRHQDDGYARPEERAWVTPSASGSARSFPPYLAIALGAGDATLMEVTSAYTVFPNQGVRMKPFRHSQDHGSGRQPSRRKPIRAG
jgi:penicillin-binding protein 1A